VLTTGWDCIAVDAGDRLIFKFPRDDEVAQSLTREAKLLEVIRPAVTLPVPGLIVDPGPPLFSRHDKLRGEHLVTAGYERLPEAARDRLAADIAQFYAELHALDDRRMAEAGAAVIRPWLAPERILETALPLLPEGLRPRAARMITAWTRLPPDPHGTTYGFFDGRGWNMAFDAERQRLNGIYDFGDSGFGALHQEFIYTNFISPDLTARSVAAYERVTGRHLDRERIALLTAVHRLSELAEVSASHPLAPLVHDYAVAWLRG
jgi:aminoglycoside phosphotransferase (APT) family kinase protein